MYTRRYIALHYILVQSCIDYIKSVLIVHLSLVTRSLGLATGCPPAGCQRGGTAYPTKPTAASALAPQATPANTVYSSNSIARKDI